ncbi:hypothetical protein [Actinoplanes subtropicus]|uniref:hypothetical protein n=1 Tax=Actinoplanes subtropicus TaxID=543632 RepID=UPI0012F7FFC4|nr:hypothetical protein [Actinoplanes subtropicus]
MANPATEVRELLARWCEGPPARGDVLADLDRRGWPSVSSPDDLSAAIADPGWGREQGYFLLLAFDRHDLAGFTAFVPTGSRAEPVPSAVAIGSAAQRLWGAGDRLGPGWLAWDTPCGRCEIKQADATVVSWLYTGPDGQRRPAAAS